ncbi:hypothetical protein Y032_0155g3031 [Ancylostoma ceylanicum]|uniref:Uncharacterized protein n=1 Tax=Ancylostoma ceylanicum TaxID=53326 RepID=A0A016SZA9_9BILA|nr:hypothetical protein Y032_0155g3031 [Ancylostoma ceylanicum]
MKCSPECLLITVVTWILLIAVIYRSRQRPPSELTVKTALGYVTYNELDERVFFPYNFKLLAAARPLPILDFITKPTCEQVFFDWLYIANASIKFDAPPRKVPDPLKDEFLMNGHSVLVGHRYRNEHVAPLPKEWEEIPKWMNLEEGQLIGIANYAEESMALYHAFIEFPPENKKGLVIGSEIPWVEVFALRKGASEILTVEYQKLNIHGTERVKYIHPIELAEKWRQYEGKFDFAVAFSSIEHSGLGRYGDSLDPIGDLREVWKTACLLKPGGYFYLGLPRGQDALVFNLHRIYGALRLAMVMTGFEWVATYRGHTRVAVQLTQCDLEYPPNPPARQDLFVLRKQ